MSDELPIPWKKAQVLGTIIASILIPIIIAFLGHVINQSIKGNELSLRYIELAVGILKEEPKKGTENLRSWAIDVVNSYSKVKLTQNAKKELKESPLPSLSETPFSKYLIPEKLAEAENALIQSIKVPDSATTVKDGSKYMSRGGEQVIGIVLHNAIGPEATVKFLREGDRRISLHWIVLPSGKIVPLVNEDLAALHIGKTQKPDWNNRTTIGVTVAGEAPLSQPKQVAALYRLLADICKRRHLEVEAILSHDEISPFKKEIPKHQMNEIRERVAKIIHESSF